MIYNPRILNNSYEKSEQQIAMQIHPSKIGFDIDGVIADTSEAFLRIARDEFGHTHLRHEHITDFDVAACLDIDPAEVNLIFDRLMHDPVREGLKPMENAVSVLENFSRTAPISFITARPRKEPIAHWLEKNLGSRLFRRTRLIAMGDHNGKTDYIKEWGLEYFIDDRPQTCHLLFKEGITPIVFDQPWNRGRHTFTTVHDWQAIARLCV